MDHNNILGTVLAGGKSQRFGEDKSQVKLAGKILILMKVIYFSLSQITHDIIYLAYGRLIY